MPALVLLGTTVCAAEMLIVFSEQYCTSKVVYNSWKNGRNGGGKFSLNMDVMAAESGWEAGEMKNDDNYDDGDGREA